MTYENIHSYTNKKADIFTYEKPALLVVDMQKDFVDGALGTAEAQAIVGNVMDKILNFDGQIFATLDTHTENYLQSAEGKKLPVAHCIKGTAGWMLDDGVAACLEQKGYTPVEKVTFGSVLLPRLLYQAAAGEPFTAELVGLCTDICVISNANGPPFPRPSARWPEPWESPARRQ